MKSFRIPLAFTFLCFVAAPSVADQRPENEAAEVAQLRKSFQSQVEQLSFQGGVDQNRSFERVSQPVLNWSNPERSTPAGAMFVWTLDNRPEVAACVFPRQGDEPVLELLSLSRSPFEMSSHTSSSAWLPSEPGARVSDFKPVRKAAPSRALRSREMRLIAREFAARVLRGKMPSIPLRLLPRPVYRYASQPQAEQHSIVDGALFCFVQGTDPEILLMLEATPDSEQQLVWRYAVGRMSRFELEVEHKGELIKEFPWSPLDATRTYYVIK